jgi:predicted DCC family thiol-disulfide oxidoreductase YuxK
MKMKNFSSIHSDPTEMTELKKGRSPDRPDHVTQASRLSNRFQGWILYDGDCRYCIAAAKQFEQLFARRGFYFIPLQTRWVQERFGLHPGAALTEMRVLTIENQDLGGADAVIFLAGRIWWSSPLAMLTRLPFMHAIVDGAYRWIAARRGCTHLTCGARNTTGRDELRLVPHINGTPRRASLPVRITPWLGLVVLPVLAMLIRSHVAPWIFMWLMTGAIFFGCKWLTFWRARQCIDSNLGRSLGYLFGWAGMDAASFLGPRREQGNVSALTSRVSLALLKILLGILFIFGLARLAPNQLLAGWIGMIGMILILHFGLFDLAAIAWRIAGINAQPIMNAPIRATSLSEFWGRRWNGAFNQLVVDVLFRRLARSIGVVRATLTAFLLSGLLHELVISFPARAGYGLPTTYFLWQGWGVVAQRSTVGNQLAFRHGISGRIFTILIAAGPAFWLFHPPFVRNVILPFMKAIGAL